MSDLGSKSPYWDYCSVRIDFEDGTDYRKYTVDDPYFTLFNIGYSLERNLPHLQIYKQSP